MKKFFNGIRILKEKLQRFRRTKDNKKRRKYLKNKTLSLLSCNCVGCCMLNDLGLRFNSPFVNLYLEAKYFLKYLQNFSYYNKQELNFIESETYPIALLDDIKIYFVHYKTKEDALSAWKRRIERINYSNLFVIFSDREGCTYEDLQTFNNLPFENKIVFTHKPYPEFQSAIYIKGFENEECVGNLINWKPHSFGKRYYDDFDFVSWFNGEKVE